MNPLWQLFSWLMVLLLIGCVKEPGIGGRGEIHGRVMEKHQENEAYYPRQDYRVYIIYGAGEGASGEAHDDDVLTGPDGRFRFPWLRKGSYRIYAYTECEQDEGSCPNGIEPVFHDVKIEGMKDLVDVGDIQITNY